MSTRYLECNSNVANISGTKFSVRVAVVTVTVLTVALIVIIVRSLQFHVSILSNIYVTLLFFLSYISLFM